MILCLIFILPVLIICFVLGRLLYAIYHDVKNPPTPTYYTWKTIYHEYKGEWERGNYTLVYHDDDNNIRAKVIKTKEALYRATMWNGYHKEFIYEHEAIKSVEEYKPRVYK